MKRFFENWPFHPIVFAAYPALYLYAQNWRETRPGDLTVPLLLSIAAAVVITALLVAAARTRHRGALCASIFVGAFFAAPVYNVSTTFAGVVWGATALFVVAFVFLARRDTPGATPALNVLALVLIASPLYTAITSVTEQAEALPAPPDEPMIATDIVLTPGDDPPNIYFILPDGYARADVLQEYYELDNQPFIDFLRSQGFYVADNAPANHTRTVAALPTLLNFADMREVLGDKFRGASNVDIFRTYTVRSRVRWLFQQAGYDVWYLASGVDAYNRIAAKNYLDANILLSEFETVFLNFTPIPLLAPSLGIRNPYDLQRQSALFMAEELKRVARDAANPKFVFLHILIPHPPFVFDAEGNPVNPDYPFEMLDGSSLVDVHISREQYVAQYRDQLIYTNTVLKDLVQSIRDTDPNAVIVLQSDHGPGSQMNWSHLNRTNFHERATILNAFYLPGVEESQLYDSISPINTFPVIFNAYFGTDIPLLPDHSYFSTSSNPLHFIRVEPDGPAAETD